MTASSMRFSVLAVICGLASPSAWSGEYQCDQVGSNSAVYECLAKALRIEDNKLKRKVSTLIQSVKQSDHEAAYKEIVVKNVLAADKQWRALLAAECALTGFYYFGGTLQGNAELECKVLRTAERTKFVSESDIYKLLVD
ncbi:hypothetical protein DBR42_20540 [Pelomonas sp. HMWF004]|nr:hypothetical protein DBR42_20540 [Pelomonas sp. HMWF004]